MYKLNITTASPVFKAPYSPPKINQTINQFPILIQSGRKRGIEPVLVEESGVYPTHTSFNSQNRVTSNSPRRLDMPSQEFLDSTRCK